MKEMKLVKHSLQLAHSYKNIQSPPTSRWGFFSASPHPANSCGLSTGKHNCHTTGAGLGRGGAKSRLKGPQEVGMENRKQMKQDFWDVYAQGEMLDIFSGKEK